MSLSHKESISVMDTDEATTAEGIAEAFSMVTGEGYVTCEDIDLRKPSRG